MRSIYISAVPEELSSVRETVAAAVRARGFNPVWMNEPGEAGPDWTGPLGRLRRNTALMRQLSQVSGVIQIVGGHFGKLLPPATPKAPPMSQAQLEAETARRQLKRIYYILLDDFHSVDLGAEPEPPELEGKQAAYRLMLKSRWPKLCRASNTPTQTQAAVWEIIALKKFSFWPTRWIAIMQLFNAVILCSAAIHHWTQASHKVSYNSSAPSTSNSKKHKETEFEKVARLRRELTKPADLAKAVADTQAMVAKWPPGGAELPKTEREASAIYERELKLIASMRNVDAVVLREELNDQAAKVWYDDKSTWQQRRDGMRAAGRLFRHRDFEGPGLRPLPEPGQRETPETMEVWLAGARFFIDYGRYDWAAGRAEWVQTWADKDRDFHTWSAATHQMGRAYLRNGEAYKAQGVFHQLVSMRTKVYGPENHDTLASRMCEAIAKQDAGLVDEAEKELLEIIAIQEKNLGRDHEDTLASRSNWVTNLSLQRRHPEALDESQKILAAREKVLGTDHADTLRAMYHVAREMSFDASRHDEALALARQAQQGLEKVLPSGHTYVKHARKLIQCLGRKGTPCEKALAL